MIGPGSDKSLISTIDRPLEKDQKIRELLLTRLDGQQKIQEAQDSKNGLHE